MKLIKIDVTMIDKARLFRSTKNSSVYLDAVMFENRDGPDKYGWEGVICQSVTKEEREAGVKGAILGNFKSLGARPQPKGGQQSPRPISRQQALPTRPPSDPDLDDDSGEIPF